MLIVDDVTREKMVGGVSPGFLGAVLSKPQKYRNTK
jgi:hypothetical protein